MGIGYGWSIRGTAGALAAIGLFFGLRYGVVWIRELSLAGVLLAIMAATLQSWTRRKAGVAGQREIAVERSERVAAMTGIDRRPEAKATPSSDADVKEFDPRLDLIAPVVAIPGLIAAGIAAGDPAWLQIARMVIGALFMGAVTDAMLLGHWYLVQPGLSRAPLNELVGWTAVLWLPETILFLLPTGMLSALDGSIDDGYGGMLGWFWVACVVATIGLLAVTVAALREKQYSAVMAATGLLYLAILTGFGVDLVARAILAI